MGSATSAAAGWSGSCTALSVLEAAGARGRPTSSSGRGKWWLHVIGKATPEGGLPVSMALVRADFARYKAFQGLPSVPSCHEPRPAVMSIAGDDA